MFCGCVNPCKNRINEKETNMHLCESEKVPYYKFSLFESFPEIRHGLFTRHGGYSKHSFSTLNAGLNSGDDIETVRKNRDLILKTIGGRKLISVRQVHEADVLVLSEKNGDVNKTESLNPVEADAIITDITGLTLLILVADCQPVLLYCLPALNYTKRDIETLNGVQTRFVKTFMGLPNTCRHSKLLTALHITSVHFVLTDTLCSLFNRILCLPSRSVATSVLMYAVQCFMGDGYVHNGTLIDRILKLQISPLRALYGPPRELAPPDGTVDSITNVLNMNLCKNSYEQQLLFLLCRF